MTGGGLPGHGPVAVAQDQLDLLLAVRRWLLDTPEATVVMPPAGSWGACALEVWRTQALERLLGMLSG